MMKPLIISLIILSIPFNFVKAQYDFIQYYHTGISKVDTIVNIHIYDLGYDNLKQAIYDYELSYAYPNSSRHRYYQIYSGKLIDNKKFGTWYMAWGDFENNQRLNRGIERQYFINNYLIPNTRSFSDSVDVDVSHQKITCFFTFVKPNHNSSIHPLKIDYWIKDNCDTTFVKCSNIEGCVLFETTTEYVNEEFNLLYSGYYNRKITKATPQE